MGPTSESRVAIVTGASVRYTCNDSHSLTTDRAQSGMGEALTRELVNRGWFVAMADIRESPALSAELGSRAAFYKTNVADYASQAATFSAVFRTHGRIDALCANAGICDKGSIFILNHRNKDEIPAAPDLTCTDVDWKGVVYGTQLSIHFMRKNTTPGGVIVATASITAMHPHPSYPEYNGAKAAVLNFVRGSAEVLRLKENIRINCVMPGIVDTAIVPRQMLAAVDPASMTPVSNIVKTYIRLLDDETLTGQGIECSVDKQLPFPDPPLLNGAHTKRAITVWEPLFKLMHGEASGLEGVIPGDDFVM
ncbi:hypothetical protein LTR10_001987 [Elasticomyces elasticus]|nr:hypothetical protein LTR10_001987 [Elasticomyces elasticus]KAK4969201.1 hypothetical protein LTR42_009480 [Elasticomyces elasticus]